MKFNVTPKSLEKIKTDCLILGVFEAGKPTQVFEKINKITKGGLLRALNLATKENDFQGKIGQTHLLSGLPHLTTSRILLVGCGKTSPLTTRDYRKIISLSTKALMTTNIQRASHFLTELNVENHSSPWKMKQALECIRDALYYFDSFKSEKIRPRALQEITFYLDSPKQLDACQLAIKQGLATADGVDLTKNLANSPSNICTPTYLANQAKKLAKIYSSMTVKSLDKKAIKKYGMGAFAAVTQGSHEDAKLVCMTYKGTKQQKKPIVLVGKGVTFDTGGINTKPADGMYGMKYDMCGAATVIGVMKAIAALKLPLYVIGLLACVENMPGGGAVKPEDIVQTLSGKTIEIMNTDAEGRLILCDTLTYAEQFNPDTVIDIATLTGAVVMALGIHTSGLLSNHAPLADALFAAGLESHDRAWILPLWDEYQEQIKSTFADISNTGGRGAGTITAACFLSRFTQKFEWAHLDVAGTAAMMGAGAGERMATGRPVPLLTQYLINRSKKSHDKN